MKKTAKSSELSEVKRHEVNDKKTGETPDTDKVKKAKNSNATLPHKSSASSSRTNSKGDRVGKRLADAIAIEVADTDLSAITGGSRETSLKPEKNAMSKRGSTKRGSKKASKNTEAAISPEVESSAIDKTTAVDEMPTANDMAAYETDNKDVEVKAEASSYEATANGGADGDVKKNAPSEMDTEAASDTMTEGTETAAETASVKAVAEKKKKKISTSARGATDIELNAEEKKTPTANVKKKKKRKNDEVSLTVEDNGTGINSKEITDAVEDGTANDSSDAITEAVGRDDGGEDYAEISGDPIESYDPFASLGDEATHISEIELFPSELTPYEDDEIVDTHESAEEAASYEAFVQDYQATIQEMLRRAAEKEYNKDENGNPQLTIEADDELDELFDDDIGDEDDEALDEILVSEDTAGDTDDEDEEYLSGEDYEAILKASEGDTSGALALEDILIAETESVEDITPELENTDGMTVEETVTEEAVPYTDEVGGEDEHVLYIEKRDDVQEAVGETVTETDEEKLDRDVEELQIKLEDTESGAAVLDISVRTENERTPTDTESASAETADDQTDNAEVSVGDDTTDDAEELAYEDEQIAIEFIEETKDTEKTEDAEETEEYEDETPPAYNPDKPRFIDTVFEIIELFVFTLVAVMVVTSFFLRHSIVDGSSMQHTLEDKDILLISDFLYTPERGDIIVFADYEKGQREPLVKRVIGIEGDVVEVTDDYRVYVNGELLDEDYVLLDEPYFSAITGTWQVGDGELFVLGDHRSISLDSRAFGVVSEDCVLGKVLLRLYPFDSFGTVD